MQTILFGAECHSIATAGTSRTRTPTNAAVAVKLQQKQQHKLQKKGMLAGAGRVKHAQNTVRRLCAQPGEPERLGATALEQRRRRR